MTNRQERFCLEYIKSGNATQAYKDAGYTAKTSHTAEVMASRLLRKDVVAARIQALQSKLTDEKILDAKKRREILSNIATDSESTKQDVIKAIDTLNKMDGAYLNRTEITGGLPVVICDDITEDVRQREA